MPNKSNPDDFGRLWQEQETEKMTITLDEIRRKATRFERRISRRNLREYVAATLVTALLAARLRSLHGWRLAPPLLLIAGTLFSMWQLHRRGAASAPPDAGVYACIEFHRRELERQRDALRGVWTWYLLPLIPGLIASALEAPSISVSIMAGAAFALVLAGIWKLNDYAANKLNDELRNLERL